MNIKDIELKKIINDDSLKKKFLYSTNKKLNITCNSLIGNFYLDSFNFFPITEDHYTFKNFYVWPDKMIEYQKFYTKKFADIFNKRKNLFKEFSDAFILGSSVSDDYYRNLIYFLPRIFFIHQKEINLVLHRDSSNKFRKFIIEILKQNKIQIKKFIYLDNDFYKFNNSFIPRYFKLIDSIRILRHNLLKDVQKKKSKIFISRQTSSSRNLVNESDFNLLLKSQGFKIINITNLSFFEQIKVFASAEIIISPTSSVLANLAFCSPETKVIEITPKYQFEYENNLKFRYARICKQLNLKYSFIEADPVKIKKFQSNLNKFISKKVLDKSNYYQDLILDKKKFEKLFLKN